MKMPVTKEKALENGGRIEQSMDYIVTFASGNHPKTNMTINRIRPAPSACRWEKSHVCKDVAKR